MAGMERFTQRARRVLSLAHQEAERMRQDAIGTEHILVGLIQEEGGVAGRVLRDLGLDTERVREMVERLGGRSDSSNKRLDLSPGVQEVLEFAIEEARQMGAPLYWYRTYLISPGAFGSGTGNGSVT